MSRLAKVKKQIQNVLKQLTTPPQKQLIPVRVQNKPNSKPTTKQQ